MSLGHPIRSAAKQTGLSPHLIRIWERRYGAVFPERTDGNHRLYSDEDIYRLTLLRDAVEQGESISQISELTNTELQDLVRTAEKETNGADQQESYRDDSVDVTDLLDQCIDSVSGFNSARLESLLFTASIKLSRRSLLEELVGPLLTEIGELWRDGRIKVAHEHLASAVIRSFLGNLYYQSRSKPGAPGIVCATPTSQVHELGALMVAVTADSEGWNTTFLGADIPADDIAGAAISTNAKAVALSITFTGESNALIAELRTLRRMLPERTALLVGGRSAPEFSNVIDEIGAMQVADLSDFRSELQKVRNR